MSSPVETQLPTAADFLNRELSLLEFNARVLRQAIDEAVPLLERLRFLTISSTNLDEFFEIRVSRLHQQVAYGVPSRRPEGLTAQEILQRVGVAAHDLVAEQYRVLDEVLLPALDAQGIHLLSRQKWSPRQEHWTRLYFRTDVLPVLSPIGLDPAHPFPHVQNKNLNLVVSLDGTDAFGRRSGIAIVQLPRALPRVLALPMEEGAEGRDFVLLSSVVQCWIGELFPGMTVTDCQPFRITRDSDLWVAEEETDDLLQALRGELHRRNDGDAVRLEVADDCAPDMARFLLAQFELTEADLYRVAGPVNLHRLAVVCDLAERPDLRYAPHAPRLPKDWNPDESLFDRLQRGDLLLHHPYDSGGPVLELLRAAAADPEVLAIKQTLYRTGPHSPFVGALIEAARAGKEVTAVVELRARFDEAANIDLATHLHEAGANVVYGVVAHKTHAKMLLVVRRENGHIRRYVHVGTGNYHLTTSRLYTDLSLLSCDEALGEDVHNIFLELTGLGSERQLARLLQAPFTLHPTIVALIDAEAEAARQGRPARILAKMNGLTEPQVIQALYRASQAGVQIDLIVRGICCLRPGVPGLSETIRVRSLIGRFLEHARVCWFHADGQGLLYGASADWMERNFSRRIEIAFPILAPDLKARVLEECLEGPLRDNTQAWVLQADGRYVRCEPGDQPPVAWQEHLMR
jgi:polyphosphate kinase